MSIGNTTYTETQKQTFLVAPPPRYVLGKGNFLKTVSVLTLTSYRTDTADLYLSGTHRGATEIFILQSEPEQPRC